MGATKRKASTISSNSEARVLASINVLHPPRLRKRVWRACLPCKRKKAKCNGEEICQTCTASNTECVYPEQHGRGVDPEYNQALEGRLQSIEDMFRGYMMRQNDVSVDETSQHDEATVTRYTSDSQMQLVPVARMLGHHAADPFDLPPNDQLQELLPLHDHLQELLPPNDHLQQSLPPNDQLQKLAQSFPPLDDAQHFGNVIERLSADRVPKTLRAPKPPSYTDENGMLELDTAGQLR